MKYLITLLIAALSLNAIGQVPDYVPSDGLVAWYPFNGNADDESPNENNGSIFGPVLTHDRFNEPNAAFAFEHNRIEVPNSEGLDQIRTISFWFNSNSNASNQVAFKQNIFEDAQSERLVCSINWNGAWCHFATKENCNASWQYDNFSLSGNDGNWHHFVGLLDGNEKRVYIDGNFMISSPVNLNNLCSGGNCIIGQEWSGVNYDFIGSLDDFGFWNRALTTEEIANLFSAPAPQDGCTDSFACNYNAESLEDDGSCDYTCCPGPGCCSIGHYWDWELEQCFDINPTDTNLDGCTDLNDLMDILANYGDCAVAETNHSLSFDGVGDYVDLGDNLYDSNQGAIMCWIKFLDGAVATDGSNHVPIFTQTEGTSFNNSLRLSVLNNSFFFVVDYRECSNNLYPSAEAEITLNNNIWYHIAVTSDANNWQLYINGENVAYVLDPGTDQQNGEWFFDQCEGDKQDYIGRWERSISDDYFLGYIDEFQIWNSALTQQEIQSYMSTPPTGNEEGLVGYWDFNEGTGSTLTDQTSNGNDGTINGATWSTDVPTAP